MGLCSFILLNSYYKVWRNIKYCCILCLTGKSIKINLKGVLFMGIFDGFFGSLFDMDNDGQLDSFEKSLDFATFMCMVEDEDSSDEDYDFYDEY